MTDASRLYDLFVQHPQVTTDSRACPAGSLFFALRGERFDGNDYAQAALAKGCAYAVVDRPDRAGEDERMIVVDDTLKALQALARQHRRTLGLPVIAITGTNGKTTTKELTAAVLKRKYNVLYTEGNLNNAIGVPLTLLRLTKEHQLAVIEMGASHPGDIKELVDIAEPDYGLITNVGKAHLLGFGSFEGVVRTKGELYDYLQAHDGLAFVNEQDERLMSTCRVARQVLYGHNGSFIACDPTLRFSLKTEGGAKQKEVQTHLIGAYNLTNALAAAAVGTYFDVPTDDICEAIAAYTPTNQRSQLVSTPRNTLVLDAYNANPTSMHAAIDNFALLPSPDKLCILGDMKELGEASLEEHRQLCERLATMGIAAWLVGEEFAQAAKAFLPAHLRCFSDVEAVSTELQAHPLEGKTILIKGSHSTRLYTLPAYL